MGDQNYKAAYERQKLARERAELLLENRSRDLYDSKLELEKTLEQMKSQQAQLLHQEKLASIGQLAAGVAHEINNPVGFIKSNMASLKNYTANFFTIFASYQSLASALASVEVSNEIKDLLSNIKDMEEGFDIEYLLEDTTSLIDESLDGADRIIKIVNSLRSFSRVDGDQREALDVNQCIGDTIKLVESEIKFKANLIVEMDELPMTMGYPGGLSQVILNLLVNASQAIEEFGKIVVSTSCDGEWILIKVKDNGSGIDRKHLERIFEAFYTTKEIGVGTGLGLSISAGIIEQHEGKIYVDSTVGEGTCFSIALPIIHRDEEEE